MLKIIFKNSYLFIIYPFYKLKWVVFKNSKWSKMDDRLVDIQYFLLFKEFRK